MVQSQMSLAFRSMMCSNVDCIRERGNSGFGGSLSSGSFQGSFPAMSKHITSAERNGRLIAPRPITGCQLYGNGSATDCRNNALTSLLPSLLSRKIPSAFSVERIRLYLMNHHGIQQR